MNERRMQGIIPANRDGKHRYEYYEKWCKFSLYAKALIY